jgi:hypothetical protein
VKNVNMNEIVERLDFLESKIAILERKLNNIRPTLSLFKKEQANQNNDDALDRLFEDNL